MSEGFTKVLVKSEVPEGTLKLAQLGGKRVVVANVGGNFFAMGEVCTHMGGPLSRGRLNGFVITCPWHGSRFDVRTGAVAGGPAVRPEPSYDVKVDGNDILIKEN